MPPRNDIEENLREQNTKKRIKNFNEVTLGYTEKGAVKEAKRCINCKRPLCVSGCPVEIDIPGFIKAIAMRKFDAAVKILKDKNYQFLTGGQIYATISKN